VLLLLIVGSTLLSGTGSAALAGLGCFFLLERLAVWRHCHAGKCEIHSSAASLILLGDALHNLVDGVVIAVHEIPQETGDFFILLEGGFTRRKVFGWNVMSSLAALAGGLIAYAWVLPAKSSTPYVMAFSAVTFIYIVLADLIPGHRRETSLNSVLQQFGLIVGGSGPSSTECKNRASSGM